MVHTLKILPKYFDDVQAGRKSFELRRNDRNFSVGDCLYLQEWHDGIYTGRSIKMKVIYILLGGIYGLDAEFCILGLRPWTR